MTKQPSYRFVGYTEPWAEKKLGNLGSVEMCRRIFKEETSAEFEIPFFKIGTFGGEADTYITREKFEEYKTKFAYPQRGDLLLSASGSIGRVVEYDGDEAYYQDSNIVWLNHHGKINNKFLKAFYEIVSWSGIEGTTIKRLYNKNILETDISLPSLPEQTAIGSLFQDIDQLISLQQRKLEVLKEQKKTYLKLLFPAKGQTKPALRFAGFEDEWKEKYLYEVLKVSKDRNVDLAYDKNQVLSVSREAGVVNQIEYQGRSFAGADLSNYKVVNKENLIYTKSPLKGAPYGIFQISYTTGIVSPLYAVFKSTKQIFAPFVGLSLMDDNKASKYLSPIVTKGAKNTINITDEGSLQGKLLFPSMEEQRIIHTFFQDLDKSIAKQEEKVNQLKESKQTLLRKMFI